MKDSIPGLSHMPSELLSYLTPDGDNSTTAHALDAWQYAPQLPYV